MICSISHAWETREHPDPLRFQLQILVNGLSMYDLAYLSEIWFFYDYVSLFQWQRKTTVQERSFRRAMGNMHLLYAHQSSLTFRLEHLTPPDLWASARNDETFRVPVYHEASGAVVFIPLRDLVENRANYNGRGWCIAEKEWSAARSVLGQNMVMDGEADASENQPTKKVPTAPDAFIGQMASSEFTHRNDAKDVAHLQEKIFHEKVTARKHLKLSDLTEDHMTELTGSLPHYRSLRVLKISAFSADVGQVIAFAQAEPLFMSLFFLQEQICWVLSSGPICFLFLSMLESCILHGRPWALCHWRSWTYGRHEVETPELPWPRPGHWDSVRSDVGGSLWLPEALAAILKEHKSLKELKLASGPVGDVGAQAWGAIIPDASRQQPPTPQDFGCISFVWGRCSLVGKTAKLVVK